MLKLRYCGPTSGIINSKHWNSAINSSGWHWLWTSRGSVSWRCLWSHLLVFHGLGFFFYFSCDVRKSSCLRPLYGIKESRTFYTLCDSDCCQFQCLCSVTKLKSNILLSRICLSRHRIVSFFFQKGFPRFIINKLSVTCKHSDIGNLTLWWPH